MIGLVLDVVVIGLVLLALYFFLVFIVSMILGVPFQKALKKVQSFLSATKTPLFENDTTVFTEFYAKLKDLIGETLFSALERKAKLCFDTPPYGVCTTTAVPFFYFSCIYKDDEDKEILSLITEKIIVNRLHLFSYPDLVYISWDIHQEIKCPIILAYFARNEDELARLKLLISNEDTDDTIIKEE